MYSYPFEKHTPSIFVVGTPFQALCAVEAIREFEIDDYQFYAVTNRSSRDEQMLTVLKYFNVKYQVIDKYKEIYPFSKRLLILRSNKCRYHRAFVGSLNSLHLYFFAIRQLSNASLIVSLDDGNNTITILTNKKIISSRHPFTFLNNVLLTIAKIVRGIVLQKHLYTIYSDIQNDKYVIRSNKLSHLFQERRHNESSGVFFVGTNPPSFRNQMDIDIILYYQLLDRCLCQVLANYPNNRYYYVLHGNDREEQTRATCLKYGVECILPSTIIELFMCNLDCAPKIVIGFTSTALLNLKKMFPTSKVYNILVEHEGKTKEPYKTFSTYYERNDIITIKECI